MLVFSFVWTSQQATKRIREINSKSKDIVSHNFEEYYSSMFTQFECSKPEPVMDVDFDDFADLNFGLYKDVHIHSMDIYDNGAYLCGLEMYYLVDGDVMRYILHHRVKKAI